MRNIHNQWKYVTFSGVYNEFKIAIINPTLLVIGGMYANFKIYIISMVIFN